MCANDAADAVLERRDDPATIGVIFRVGAEDQANVQFKPHRVASYLDVAFLEHVEQADLNLGRQIGQLVHAEDAAIAAGNQAEMHGRLAGKIAALGVLDHVDLADQIGHGDVRRGQFFMVTLLRPPTQLACRLRTGRVGPGHSG